MEASDARAEPVVPTDHIYCNIHVAKDPLLGKFLMANYILLTLDTQAINVGGYYGDLRI